MKTIKIPPQAASEDTSNWDDRAFITPRDSREVVFHRLKKQADNVSIVNPYLQQEERKKTKRSKKSSE